NSEPAPRTQIECPMRPAPGASRRMLRACRRGGVSSSGESIEIHERSLMSPTSCSPAKMSRPSRCAQLEGFGRAADQDEWDWIVQHPLGLEGQRRFRSQSVDEVVLQDDLLATN